MWWRADEIGEKFIGGFVGKFAAVEEEDGGVEDEEVCEDGNQLVGA